MALPRPAVGGTRWPGTGGGRDGLAMCGCRKAMVLEACLSPNRPVEITSAVGRVSEGAKRCVGPRARPSHFFPSLCARDFHFLCLVGPVGLRARLCDAVIHSLLLSLSSQPTERTKKGDANIPGLGRPTIVPSWTCCDRCKVRKSEIEIGKMTQARRQMAGQRWMTSGLGPTQVQRQANGCPRLACSCSWVPSFQVPSHGFVMGMIRTFLSRDELCLAAQMKLATMEG